MQLSSEKFNKKQLEKEIDKKKFNDTMQASDDKIKIKQLQIDLTKSKTTSSSFESKYFDS